MSFASEYEKLRKKRLEEEEKKKGAVTSPGDIAPVFRSATLTENAATRAKYLKSEAPVEEKPDYSSYTPEELVKMTLKEKKASEGGYFKSGSLSDGYQFGDITKGTLATVGELASGVAEGALKLGEGVTDLILHGSSALLKKVGKNNGEGADWLADELKYLANDDTIDNLFDGLGRSRNSFLGDKGRGIGEALGQVGAIIATGGAAAGAGLGTAGVTAVTTGTTFASSMGGGISEAYNSGATEGEAWGYGAWSGFVDAGTELIFGGLGKTIKATGLSKGLSSADDVFARKVSSKISNQFAKNMVEFGVKAGAEGTEEVLAGIGSAIGKKFTYMSEEEFGQLIEDEQLLDQFITGAVASGLAQSGYVPGMSEGSLREANKAGRDFISGLTQNETKVADKEYENRIAAEESDGKKLTNKEKNKIYEEVLEDIKKGYVSTDTIEEVLGGDSYKSYKDTIDGEEAAIKELEGIYEGEELEAAIRDILDNSERGNLKGKLGEDVLNQAIKDKDSYLVNSYAEMAKRGQKFEADLDSYTNEYAKQTIKNIMDSGVANNSGRMHDFANNVLAKISADKSIVFSVTDAKKLAGTSFAVDGKTVNGYVTEDGVTINIDSPKYLNTVVGHEITHVLEGTEFYDALQEAVFEYAEAKGEYKDRLYNTRQLYKDVEGYKGVEGFKKIKKEVAADLVGDYLFTDSDFIANLSTKNRNLFQKVFDEIKYLYKIATAGSKEKRQLERVKRAFEDAYRGESKASGDNTNVKYSLDKYSQKQYNDFGWARDTGAISKNELDDLYSKVQEKGSLKKFTQTSDGEAIIEVNDDPHATLKVNNVFAFVKGTKDAPEITRVVRVNFFDEASVDVFRKDIYERTDNRSLETLAHFMGEEAIRYYDRSSNADYRAYTDRTRSQQSGSKSERNTRANRNGNQRVWTFEEAQSNEIESKNKASSVDGVFFNGKKRKYSLSDSDGKQLTKEQGEYFKDSKMRDENGNLKVMYHGSQDAGFHTFDAKFSDDDRSFFFVDRNDVATTYSGTSETYAPKAFTTVEDANRFFAEIGADEYEVIEKDGEYTLYDDGDEVATSDSLDEIYEEWRDWSGLGYGDANYKVYLNLKNPLEVDAKGRPWNKIDAEFSQNVYDRYKSLTAEEKAALTDLAEWEDFSLFNREIQEAEGNELASAYAKMGEDCNIYDLFSVAADNFSEDSMRENARKYLKTRDYAQRAKEGGYDGVIFKNIIDNGGYSSSDEGASTVAIAFDSNQIKSVANEKPTGDPDIRYSLTEYTADEKKAHNKAVVDHFGKTYKWAETGYVLLDGTKLDLSGKHEGAPGGYRTVDHRDIVDALGNDYGDDSYSGSLVQFMSEGNIRISPESNGINLSVKPTKAQEQALADFISRCRGEMLLDIDDFNGYTVVSVEYPRGTYYTKILNDIREWFDNGKKPEVSGLNAFRSLSAEGETPRRYGRYGVKGEDVKLQTAPIREDIAENATTTTENRTTSSELEQVAPMPSEPGLYDLYRERENLEKQILEAQEGYEKTGDFGNGEQLISQYEALTEKINRMETEEKAYQSERLASLDDSDVPPEMEAPYPGEDVVPNDPFADRDMKEVSKDRSAKAYMYENPEVKPFFQEEANVLLGEYERTEKPETFYNGWAKQDMSYDFAKDIPDVYRTSRVATESIEYLRDTVGMSYADIEKGLKAIIEDHGAENIAAAKKLEFHINDRLLYGYSVEGLDIPPNQDYINLLNEKQISEYNEEAKKSFFESVNATDIAPVIQKEPTKAYEAIRPPKKSAEPRMKRITEGDIAPTATYETANKRQIDGQRTMFAEGKTAEVYDAEPEVAKKKSSGWMKFRANFLDKQSVFEDLSLETNNRELMSKANYMLSSESRAQRMIGHGIKSQNVKSLDSIREEVESTGRTKEFYEYMYHRHNIDRMNLDTRYEDMQNKPVFGDSVTAEVSQSIVEKYEAENPAFKEYAEDVYTYMNHLRKQLVNNGVISQETADLWAEMYPHYVPIRRLGDSGLNINVPLDTGKTGVNAPIKKATGGNRDILPLFDTMAMRTEQTFKAIAKNSFGVELKNTLGTTIETAETDLDGVIDSVDKHEELLQEGKNGQNPTFTVFENGERVTFEISEEMYDALKPTSKGLAYTNKVANKVGNWHRGILTEYNPVFMASNAIKDVQEIIINSRHPAKTYAKLPEAYKELATHGKWYTEYMENGGEQNTYFDGQTHTFTADDTGIKKIIGLPLRGIKAANNFIERAPRLAEYIASREAGESVETAMLDAARVTTNFQAGGDVTKFLNRNGATFLNASVQGAMQQVRNVREAKANGLKGWVQLATKFVIAGLPALLLNKLLWDDDEEYEELSDYVKDNYYIVAKYGDGQFVRIPKGRTVAVIQDAFEQISNAATGDDEVDLKSFLELAISNLAPNDPVNDNILSPIIQAYNNETWYGEDLVPTRLQDLPAAEQYDESTDALSKWLGETFNVSPYKLNYLLDQYSGGVGDVFLPMMTPEAERGNDSLLGNMIAPFKDKFTTDSTMNNQNVSDFYDTMDKLTANAKSSKATDEDVLKYKYMNSINSELGKLYAKKREIQSSDLSSAEKYEAVREVQEQIVALTRESLDTYENVQISDGYAVIGDRHYRLTDKGEWQKISEKQLESQEDVTGGLGISASDYWSNKTEYDFAYEYPEKYTVAKALGGYESYKKYSSELYDIKADKDENGKSITGSRKEKVIEYVNGLDIDYGARLIIFKNEYNADDTYNYEIIDYLNSRQDISFEEMATILKELGFDVDSDGNISWD